MNDLLFLYCCVDIFVQTSELLNQNILNSEEKMICL